MDGDKDEDSDAHNDVDDNARSGVDNDGDTDGDIHRNVDGARSDVRVLKLKHFNKIPITFYSLITLTGIY